MSHWHVMKFGGSSLADLARVRRVVGIVQEQAARHPVALVVSAPGDSTDRLARSFEAALDRRREVVRRELHAWRSWLARFAMPGVLDPGAAFRGPLAEVEDILLSL
ncbi:MAG: hypothetical protein ACPHRO_12680, partial [Nannocystaceae bacterium]